MAKLLFTACFMYFIVFGVCNILVNKKNIDQVKVPQKIFPYLYIIFFFLIQDRNFVLA